jgi:hypothetical protein
MAVEAGRHSRERRIGGGQAVLDVEDDEDRTGGRRGSKHGVHSSPELGYRRIQGRKQMHRQDGDHNDRNGLGYRTAEQGMQEGEEVEAVLLRLWLPAVTEVYERRQDNTLLAKDDAVHDVV